MAPRQVASSEALRHFKLRAGRCHDTVAKEISMKDSQLKIYIYLYIILSLYIYITYNHIYIHIA